ncbi:HAMP domain-containing histidine kinase [Alicyclobacillus tolerans]|uniref:sensor histidine kinase n=1 Tax=Alicyclobacillus tolerans TaxID=90970 RepID=UPI001F351859|nr:ATP-binding protein [Alicyclobacillus tolerans]MCF8565884.1 HAMP domain-containing histidine kinase [Alicyclobacillus tolerans]
MFKRIRTRLVLVNTAVFFAILIFICGILYGFTRQQLLSRIDFSLYAAAIPIERGFLPRNRLSTDANVLPIHPRFGQLPTTYLIWSGEGKLLFQLPSGEFTQSEVSAFHQRLNTKRPFTAMVQGHSFRVLNVAFRDSRNLFPNLGTVQVIRNIDETSHELSILLWIIVATIGFGLLMVMGAGLFLAGRALVPIRKSWDRQQKFVADASHELRTPLAVIQGQAELLLRHPERTVEQEAGSVGTIYDEARRMRKLVDSLLTLARADSNQLELDLKNVSLSQLFDSLSDMFMLLCEQQSLQLDLAIEAGIELQGDEDRLRQLILILFDNALKYTPAGGRISISCKCKGNSIHLAVADTGVGIASEDLGHIFERFYRGDKARSRQTGGAGLGLSIAEWIVKAHRGKLTVHSSPGTGSTFQVVIPT